MIFCVQNLALAATDCLICVYRNGGARNGTPEVNNQDQPERQRRQERAAQFAGVRLHVHSSFTVTDHAAKSAQWHRLRQSESVSRTGLFHRTNRKHQGWLLNHRSGRYEISQRTCISRLDQTSLIGLMSKLGSMSIRVTELRSLLAEMVAALLVR